MNQQRFVRNITHTTNSSNSKVRIKGPKTKRCFSSPVLLQGWLYKQGSDGFMLWRKRWFVLSEYCLFYYKDSSETNLLGSILLPSYKVTVCNAHDKIDRKYAFKCEHKNMRTYFLAAESNDSMMQWVRYLYMATLLQSIKPFDRNVGSCSGRALPPKQGPSLLVRGSPDINADAYASAQPLYVNAPPKPRRFNESSYSSSSLEFLGCNEWDNARGRAPSYAVHALQPNGNATGCSIYRPHSADFLSYESNGVQSMVEHVALHRAPSLSRPKSSLDLCSDRSPPIENDYYSEQQYAKKMRTSVKYIANIATPRIHRITPIASHHITQTRTTPSGHGTYNQPQQTLANNTAYPCYIEKRQHQQIEMASNNLNQAARQQEWRSPVTRTAPNRIPMQFSTPLQHSVHNSTIKSTPSAQRKVVSETNDRQASEQQQRVMHMQNFIKKNTQYEEKLQMSAGDLLGHTYEELVLLLIQLRRQSTQSLQTIEQCYREIDMIQGQIHYMDQQKKMWNLRKLELIRMHLLELEKQYEKRKPLVNLVDNMVKLGSLYRTPNEQSVQHRLKFNQLLQEKRLLAEESRDWNRLDPNRTRIHEKVQHLFQLDELIQKESFTLEQLQCNKQSIINALADIRLRMNYDRADPMQAEQVRQKQMLLENELYQVHMLLAQNSKRLEETIACNARLEQELLILKQKFQFDRRLSRESLADMVDNFSCSMQLDNELQQVQDKVDTLQKQRQDISLQVKHLVDRSNNLRKYLKPQGQLAIGYHVEVDDSTHFKLSDENRRKEGCVWGETDLDTMNFSNLRNTPETPSPIMDDGDTYYGSNNNHKKNPSAGQEKPEIKTVRIVKRESERRRDREKHMNNKGDYFDDNLMNNKTDEHLENNALTIIGNLMGEKQTVSGGSSGAGGVQGGVSASELSVDAFKSQAARQIITEMTNTGSHDHKRPVRIERRRHYTTPDGTSGVGNVPLFTDGGTTSAQNFHLTKRAKDDLDMVRALRYRINAPDVVRSTLSSNEFKFNANTIDRILSAPNKIAIPERYIPEQVPELSKEEQAHRMKKVEVIKKMLSETAILSASSASVAEHKCSEKETEATTPLHISTKIMEEKKEREHLLHLNQILANQVMEMSKAVAVTANSQRSQSPYDTASDSSSSSSVISLPLYQQRENYFS